MSSFYTAAVSCHGLCRQYEKSGPVKARCISAFSSVVVIQLFRRFAAFLLREADAAGDGQIRMTQEEMAARVNSAREVVSRTLRRFDEEGLIEYSRGRIVLRDRERLEALGSMSDG